MNFHLDEENLLQEQSPGQGAVPLQAQRGMGGAQKGREERAGKIVFHFVGTSIVIGWVIVFLRWAFKNEKNVRS